MSETQAKRQQPTITNMAFQVRTSSQPDEQKTTRKHHPPATSTEMAVDCAELHSVEKWLASNLHIVFKWPKGTVIHLEPLGPTS